MTVRIRTIAWTAVGLLMAAAICRLFLQGAATVPAVVKNGMAVEATNHSIVIKMPVVSSDGAASQTLHLRSGQVLATVNGHAITMRDVVPMSGTNQGMEIAPGDLKYFLARAVDRELILETAKAQGVELDDSQRTQIEQFRAAHGESEPGLMQRLNADPAEDELSLRDAEAFMLQTSLLAKAGVSPDVNNDEVQQYYSQHMAEFAGVSAQNADYQIRTLLAPVERQNFQNQLAMYMSQMRAAANITMGQSL